MDFSDRFWAKVNKTDGCWQWTGATNEKGYGNFGDWANRRTLKAHRVSWELTNGELGADPDLCVLHRCDNPGCVNPDHLFLGDRGVNFRDCLAKGRRPRGNPKLEPAEVIAIRLSTGTHDAIAAKFGVSRPTVTYIKNGKTWRHLPVQRLDGPMP